MIAPFAVSYTYFIFTLAWIPLWVFCFIAAKKVQQETLFVSALGAIAGFLLEWFVWTRDWVAPVTLTGTPAGIEDLIWFFTAGAFIAPLYDYWYHCLLQKRAAKY